MKRIMHSVKDEIDLLESGPDVDRCLLQQLKEKVSSLKETFQMQPEILCSQRKKRKIYYIRMLHFARSCSI